MKIFANAHPEITLISGLLSLFICVSLPTTTTPAQAAGSGTRTEKQNQKQAEIISKAQIIIKFRDNITNPAENNFVRQLSRCANAELTYLRPMSGGAHVFTAANVPDEEALKEIIKRLSQRPEIKYIQQDRIIRHQNNKMR